MAQFPFSSALVTGASSGIGEEIVRQLADANVSCVVVARRAERLEALAEELDDVEVLVADLTTKKGQRSVAKRIGSEDEPIDLVVNNAGFGTSGIFNEGSAARYRDEVELNVSALTQLSHAALAAMVPRGRGWLLNVSSMGSFQPMPGFAVYGATKAYVTSLSESLHEEVRSSGVKVTALCPGLTRTEFIEVSNTEDYESSFPDFLWTSVESVARTGLRDAAAGKPISIPGNIYKGMAVATGAAPRVLRRRISGLLPRD